MRERLSLQRGKREEHARARGRVCGRIITLALDVLITREGRYLRSVVRARAGVITCRAAWGGCGGAVTSRRCRGCWRSGRGTRLLWRRAGTWHSQVGSCGPERSLMRQHEAGRACSGGAIKGGCGGRCKRRAVGSNGRGGRLNRDCLARTHGGGGCWGMARGCLTGGSYCRGGCGRGGVEERNSPRLLLVRVRFCRTQLGRDQRGHLRAGARKGAEWRRGAVPGRPHRKGLDPEGGQERRGRERPAQHRDHLCDSRRRP